MITKLRAFFAKLRDWVAPSAEKSAGD